MNPQVWPFWWFWEVRYHNKPRSCINYTDWLKIRHFTWKPMKIHYESSVLPCCAWDRHFNTGRQRCPGHCETSCWSWSAGTADEWRSQNGEGRPKTHTHTNKQHARRVKSLRATILRVVYWRILVPLHQRRFDSWVSYANGPSILKMRPVPFAFAKSSPSLFLPRPSLFSASITSSV